MFETSGRPGALRFSELEFSQEDLLRAFLRMVREVVKNAMFGDQVDPITPGYGQNGLSLNISVPRNLRGIIPAQIVHYNAKAQGRDLTVTLNLVHED